MLMTAFCHPGKDWSNLMDWKLELVIIPVSDVDRAKEFYERAGFVRRGPEFDEAGIAHVEMLRVL